MLNKSSLTSGKGAVLRVLAIVQLTALVALLSGCGVPIFPSRPNDAPISLTSRDGNVVFHWCGKPTEEMGFLRVRFRVPADDNVDYIAADGFGRFKLETGTEFTTADPPEGFTYTTSKPVPLTDKSTYIFVFLGESYEERVPWGITFTARNLAEMQPGEWLYTSGELSSEPCGMRNAGR